MSEETEEREEGSAQGFWATRGKILLIAIGVFALLATCIFLIFILQPDDENTPDPSPVEAVTAVPTRSLFVEGVDENGVITVTLETPASLRLGGRSFNVQPQLIPTDGIWPLPTQGEGTAVWVYGSVVNYIIGLPYSSDNQALLEQLVLGDEIVLLTQDERNFTFAFNSRAQVPVSDRNIFAQNMPGITLVLLGEEGDGETDERMVVKGNYVVPEPESQSSGNVVELGQSAQLEEAQITVTGATYLPDRPEAPQGFAFFMIDYQIQNTGLTALDTGQLQMLLMDEFGNQYALNAQASQLGNFPPLSGFINAGQRREATVGYQIPVGLVSPNLNWVAGRRDTGSQIQVIIPFNGSGQAGQGTIISLQSVNVSADSTNLILVGSIVNGGGQPLVVSEQNVALRTEDGSVYLLLSTNPALPWSVAPGQTLSFSVAFQRPLATDNAIFKILNQEFQLSNLR